MFALREGTARRQTGEYDAAARCLEFALTVFTDVATRWWRARTLAELTATLDAMGAGDKADRHRSEALALCEELGTDQAKALAAGLIPRGSRGAR